jgi:hypothetical protein
MGVPQDWSHRHVIHSNPDTLDEAAAKGTLDQWMKKADDPRFVLQLEKKAGETAEESGGTMSSPPKESAGANPIGRGKRRSPRRTRSRARHLERPRRPPKPPGKNKGVPLPVKPKKPPIPSGPQLHRDWSNVMGGASGSGDVRNYPAKFGFTASAKDCSSDFIVFTTSAAGAQGGGVLASGFGVFSQPAATNRHRHDHQWHEIPHADRERHRK